MPNEKMIKLAEALASIGYEITAFKYLHDYNRIYRNIKLMLSPLFRTPILLSEEKMTQLVHTLASSGYAIVKFEFCSESPPDDIQLILYSLPEDKDDNIVSKKKKNSDNFIRSFEATIKNT